jgi:hypothetical protein
MPKSRHTLPGHTIPVSKVNGKLLPNSREPELGPHCVLREPWHGVAQGVLPERSVRLTQAHVKRHILTL